MSISDETIYYAGRVLSKYDTINCQFCAPLLNAKMDPKYLKKTT